MDNIKTADMDELLQKMKSLIDQLNAASEAYYGGRDEIMSNYEWDAMFDELSRLEDETGVILPDSPTQNVSASEESENPSGQKEQHEFPALSLAKTKKIEDLQEWAGDRTIWLSWKLDGLTLVLTYDEGKLSKILTRGNGTVGTNITYMKDVLSGFPREISHGGHLVVRGEALISYDDFERINDAIENPDDRYANPRNLASGTLALDPSRLAEVNDRHVSFNAFTLVYTDEDIKSWGERMDLLARLGFNVVDREKTTAAELPETIERWTKTVESGKMRLPVDGLVICYDDTDFAATGSVTGHHATRAGLAFKWMDEAAVSTLRNIEWSCGATTITPVAVFDPVQLEGTTVSRASLVNISEMERLGIGRNDKTEIKVIKANKIIPKIIGVNHAEGMFDIPGTCPVCGSKTEIVVGSNGAKTLKCSNQECAAKNLRKYERFVSKSGMDIDGLSVETLRDFISEGMIHNYADIFRLGQYADRIKTMDGFGEKSCENLLAAISKSGREVDPVHLITALCIPQIGSDAAKRIIGSCGWNVFLKRIGTEYGFSDIDGIGEERSRAICSWFENEGNKAVFEELLSLLNIVSVETKQPAKGKCEGVTFVITGDVHHFQNRDAFKTYVEERGGKVSGSVSKKTNFLVNNDAGSASSKNKKAKELGIPVITEDEFLKMFG